MLNAWVSLEFEEKWHLIKPWHLIETWYGYAAFIGLVFSPLAHEIMGWIKVQRRVVTYAAQ